MQGADAGMANAGSEGCWKHALLDSTRLVSLDWFLIFVGVLALLSNPSTVSIETKPWSVLGDGDRSAFVLVFSTSSSS